MSDNEDDLFQDSDDEEESPAPPRSKKTAPPPPPAAAATEDDSDSDDTAELFASAPPPANKQPKKPAAKKKNPSKVVATAAAKKKNDDDSDDQGLFDSDSDDDDEASPSKKKAPPPPIKAASTAGLSKRQRLEALAKKKQGEAPASGRNKKPSGGGDDDNGYDSGDSYDSANFQRNADDDAFIDTTGEDPDAVNELFSEQRFDDERPDREDGGGKKKKKKRKMRDDGRGGPDRDNDDDDPDGRKDDADAEPDNPIMAAVHRMKKKKREKKSLLEMEEEITTFLGRMQMAADEDERAVAERRPATHKLKMVDDVVDMLTKKDMQRQLLDMDALVQCKRWIQPLPSGGLGNVTVRQKVLQCIAQMGDVIRPLDLKRSDFGKVVMILRMHPQETPKLKRLQEQLIQEWSRPIFGKSGNMRDLSHVQQRRGEAGLNAVRRQQQQDAVRLEQSRGGGASSARGGGAADLQSLIATGKRTTNAEAAASANRVRVPFSRGFDYSVRPEARAGPMETSRSAGPAKDTRSKLGKRMQEKSRVVSKNQRSANISVEGRRTKG